MGKYSLLMVDKIKVQVLISLPQCIQAKKTTEVLTALQELGLDQIFNVYKHNLTVPAYSGLSFNLPSGKKQVDG